MSNIKPRPAVPPGNVRSDTAPEGRFPVSRDPPSPDSRKSKVEPQGQSFLVSQASMPSAALLATSCGSKMDGPHLNLTPAASGTVTARAVTAQTPPSASNHQPTVIAPQVIHTAASHSTVRGNGRRTASEKIVVASAKKAVAPRNLEAFRASGTNQCTISRSPPEKASKANVGVSVTTRKEGQRHATHPGYTSRDANVSRIAPRTKLEAATDAIVASRIAYQRFPPTNKFEAAGAALPGRFHLPGTPKQTPAPVQSPSIYGPPRQKAQNTSVNNPSQQTSNNQRQQPHQLIASKHPTHPSRPVTDKPLSTETISGTQTNQGTIGNGNRPRSSPLRSPQLLQNQNSEREHVLRHPGGAKKMFLKQWKETASAREALSTQEQQAKRSVNQPVAPMEDKLVPHPRPRRLLRAKPAERRVAQRKAMRTVPATRRKSASPAAILKGNGNISKPRHLLPMRTVQTHFGQGQQASVGRTAQLPSPTQRNVSESGRFRVQNIAPSTTNASVVHRNESVPIQHRQAPDGPRIEAGQKRQRYATSADIPDGRGNARPHRRMVQTVPGVQQNVADLRRNNDTIDQTRQNGRQMGSPDSQHLVGQGHAAAFYGHIREQNPGNIPFSVGSKTSPSSSFGKNLPQRSHTNPTVHDGPSPPNPRITSTVFRRPQPIGYRGEPMSNVQHADIMNYRTHVAQTATASPGNCSDGIASGTVVRSMQAPPVTPQGTVQLWQQGEVKPPHPMASAQPRQTTNMHSQQHTQYQGRRHSADSSARNGQPTAVDACPFKAVNDSGADNNAFPNKRRRYAKLLAIDESGIPQSVKMADQEGILMAREMVIPEGAQVGERIIESGGRAGAAQYWRNSFKLPSENKDKLMAKSIITEGQQRPTLASAVHVGTTVLRAEQPTHSEWKTPKDLSPKAMPADMSWIAQKENQRDAPQDGKVHEILGMELKKIEALARSKYNVKMNVRGRLKLERWLNGKGPNVRHAVALLALKMDMGAKIASPEQSVRIAALYDMRNHHLRILEMLSVRMGSKRENWTYICNNLPIAFVANGNERTNSSVAPSSAPVDNSVDVAAVNTSSVATQGTS